MARFIIHGGRSISGKHSVPGNKNAALPMLAACVLTEEPVTLYNLPLIEDVHTMLSILADLGVDIDLHGHTVALQAKNIKKTTLNAKLCSKVRSSILFAGPMAARFGRVSLPSPGGDVIGRRRLDTHFDGLRMLGLELSATDPYCFRRQNFRAARILLDEASVTATENILMASVLAKGETTIFNAACEPHVQHLAVFLNKMGADITGIGTNYLKVQGVDRLGGVKHHIPGDYIDAVSFMSAAVLTGGRLQIAGAPLDQFDVIARPLCKLGIKWSAKGELLHVPARQPLQVQDDFGGAITKIEDGIWPNFPSDLMSVAIVLATQARGTILFFEKLFESRLYFADRLIEMGARIIQCDPHRVVVSGPSALRGIHMASPDIRAGMALLLAALSASGKSVIDNAESIDRGYEHIDKKLRKLGADIIRTKN